MKDCPFCKIVKHELPCTKIYEDDLILGFLDIAPINPGHALLIPKTHHVSLTTVPAACLDRLMNMAPRIAQAIVREVDGEGFNIHLANGKCAGQAIPHVHLHLVPRGVADGFSWGWRSLRLDEKKHKDLAVKIIRRLDKREKT